MFAQHEHTVPTHFIQTFLLENVKNCTLISHFASASGGFAPRPYWGTSFPKTPGLAHFWKIPGSIYLRYAYGRIYMLYRIYMYIDINTINCTFICEMSTPRDNNSSDVGGLLSQVLQQTVRRNYRIKRCSMSCVVKEILAII